MAFCRGRIGFAHNQVVPPSPHLGEGERLDEGKLSKLVIGGRAAGFWQEFSVSANTGGNPSSPGAKRLRQSRNRISNIPHKGGIIGLPGFSSIFSRGNYFLPISFHIFGCRPAVIFGPEGNKKKKNKTNTQVWTFRLVVSYVSGNFFNFGNAWPPPKTGGVAAQGLRNKNPKTS